MKLVVDNQTNLARTDSHENIHPKLTQHSTTFRQGVYEVTDNFYIAVGYGLANSTMIVGTDGLIIIDVMESVEAANQVMRDFRKITSLPIKVIIYTHNHIDHVGGIKGFVSKHEVESGQVKIYAHEKLMQGIQNTSSIVGPIINLRSGYSFNLYSNKHHVNNGIGPIINAGRTTFLPPTHTFTNILTVTEVGHTFTLVHAPSETEDELFVYFPQAKVIQTADIIMGECYPNLYAIRGTKHRDPVQWYETIDTLRSYSAEYYIPSHGRPMVGASHINTMLTDYRDAIQFTHDQTVRYMNKGYTPDELVQVVYQLPEHLRTKSYLHEFYGTVKHCVRQIYNGYLGWYNGDPVTLNPLDLHTQSSKYIEYMGGRDTVLSKLAGDNSDSVTSNSETSNNVTSNSNNETSNSDSITSNNSTSNSDSKLASDNVTSNSDSKLASNNTSSNSDGTKLLSSQQHYYQWVAEITTHLLNINPHDEEARQLKSHAYRQLGYATYNINWRNWYLTSADELVNQIDNDKVEQLKGLDSRDIVSEIPIKMFLRGLCVRIDPHLCKDIVLTCVFVVSNNTHVDNNEIVKTDTSVGAETIHGLQIRRGIVEYLTNLNNVVINIQLTISADDLRSLFMRKVDLDDLISQHRIHFNKGNTDTLTEFFNYFDLDKTRPHLSVANSLLNKS